MPGRRDRNLLSGDLNEDLAVLMLRELSAVAPFRRQEDFGIDAMCTLVREEGRDLLPEDTFAVQIKSSSVRSVTLTKSQREWLESVDVPFFHAVVDREAATLELYSYEWLTSLQLESAATLTIDPDPSETGTATQPGLIAFESSDPKRSGRKVRVPAKVWLGPPILRVSQGALRDAACRKECFDLLKEWCRIVRKVTFARRHRIYRIVKWTTGHAPHSDTTIGRAQVTDEEVDALFEDLVPLLEKLHLLFNHGARSGELYAEVQALGRKAESLGFQVGFPVRERPTTRRERKRL